GGKRLALADHADRDAAAIELREVAADEDADEIEEALDLLIGTRPVFGGKAEEGQIADAATHREAHRLAERFHAAPMPLAARQAMRMRPAPVAVHDDGDMARKKSGRRIRFALRRLEPG